MSPVLDRVPADPVSGQSEAEYPNAKTIAFGFIGFIVGGLTGFLARPSVFLVGQIPFEHVISRGTKFSGLDKLLVPVAQESFNVMLLGAIIGTIIGILIGYLMDRNEPRGQNGSSA